MPAERRDHTTRSPRRSGGAARGHAASGQSGERRARGLLCYAERRAEGAVRGDRTKTNGVISDPLLSLSHSSIHHGHASNRRDGPFADFDVPPFSEANSGFDKIRQERSEWIAPQHRAMSEFESKAENICSY